MPKKRFKQSKLVEVKYNGKGIGGRGVFARKNIPIDTVIEIAPCILIPKYQIMQDPSHVLPWYVFEWSEDLYGLVLGYVSLYNHSYDANVDHDMKKDYIKMKTIRDVRAGEELCINYNGEPYDKTVIEFYHK